MQVKLLLGFMTEQPTIQPTKEISVHRKVTLQKKLIARVEFAIKGSHDINTRFNIKLDRKLITVARLNDFGYLFRMRFDKIDDHSFSISHAQNEIKCHCIGDELSKDYLIIAHMNL